MSGAQCNGINVGWFRQKNLDFFSEIFCGVEITPTFALPIAAVKAERAQDGRSSGVEKRQERV
jgi:hypothetical protein